MKLFVSWQGNFGGIKIKDFVCSPVMLKVVSIGVYFLKCCHAIGSKLDLDRQGQKGRLKCLAILLG